MAKKKSIYTETDASQARSKKKGQGNAAGVGIPTLVAAAKGLREAGKDSKGPSYRAASKIAGQEFGKDLATRNSRMPTNARGSFGRDYMPGGISEGTDMAKMMRSGQISKSKAIKLGTAGGGGVGRGGARVEGRIGGAGGGEGGILGRKKGIR